jgi:hypothetical protein
MPGTSLRKNKGEAWRLLDANRDSSQGHSEIPACVEEFSDGLGGMRRSRSRGRVARGGYSFTVYKLWTFRDLQIPHEEFSTVFLRLPQGSPIVHSFCTRTKCFLIAARDNLPHSWVHRKRGTFEACRTMIAAKLAADRRFSRVNCRGKIGSA